MLLGREVAGVVGLGAELRQHCRHSTRPRNRQSTRETTR